MTNLASAALASASALTETATSTVTLVFVHGYQGSSESFHAFPGNLQHRLITQRSMAAKVYSYEYETRGDNAQRVAEFVAWLTDIKQGLQGNVILLGHSMGGLLCVDTVRSLELEKGTREPLKFTVTQVLAFDSPFLGVHPKAMVLTGASKLNKSVSEHTSAISNLLFTANKTEANAKRGSVSSTASSSSNWGTWGAVAAVGAAAVAAAYANPKAAGSVAGVVKSAVSKVVSEHSAFLGPLWSPGDQDSRLNWILLHQQNNKFKFCCFYVITTMQESGSISRRTFISTPDAEKAYSGLFKGIEYDSTRNQKTDACADEIEAHMNMFRPAIIGDGVYENILAGTLSEM
ncbi:hypothetical protein HDU79_007382 [Rhizoclosmatium sp. JEL0117]|nr:hypothetical protein HDU79_007382 [Rhizoclosmatium sp. JEL0117]